VQQAPALQVAHCSSQLLQCSGSVHIDDAAQRDRGGNPQCAQNKKRSSEQHENSPRGCGDNASLPPLSLCVKSLLGAMIYDVNSQLYRSFLVAGGSSGGRHDA